VAQCSPIYVRKATPFRAKIAPINDGYSREIARYASLRALVGSFEMSAPAVMATFASMVTVRRFRKKINYQAVVRGQKSMPEHQRIVYGRR
jgi:hypothetical protein